MAAKLSICIPTYNRADFLDGVLGHVFDERPVACDFEVIVSDNCSTDRTSEVIGKWMARQPAMRVWRQTSNVGATNNIQCAFRLARGDYTVYLADDDRLLPGGVDHIVRLLDERPGVAAVQAASEIIDELTGDRYAPLFELAADRTFGRADPLALLNFILIDHIFPELAVYRTSALQRLALMPFKAFWAFAHLADILDCGDVAFINKPFYQSRVSVSGPPRRTLGWDEIVSNLDGYAAGLEYLAVKCYNLAGERDVRQVDVVRQLIARFIDLRLSGATGVLQKNQNWRGTYEYLSRMRARGLIDRGDSERVDGELNLRARAATQAFLDIFAAMSALSGMAVTGFPDPVSAVEAVERIHEQRPGAPVRILGRDPAAGVVDPTRLLVLAGPHADRAALVAAGYLTGLIVSEADLLRQFQP
jgi:glycosyltransferase involved in cell wall biosynthesis